MFTCCAVDWATQFGCGENDVVDLNVSDAYWSMYYVTVGRMTAGARLILLYCLLASITRSPLALDLVAYRLSLSQFCESIDTWLALGWL